MARSDDRRRRDGRRALLGLLALAVPALGGCATTQDEAARLQLNAARIRAAAVRTVVPAAGRRVRVARVTLLASHDGGSAIVVDVVNPARAAVGDLPIAVGIRGPHRRRVQLNAVSSVELSYFDAHLPVVAGGHRLSWVFTTARPLGANARPYALVGDRPSPATTGPDTGDPPLIRVRVLTRAPAGHGPAQLLISLHNASGVPQYQLPVYAVARRGGDAVAAGAAVVAHLGADATERVALTLVGPLARAQLQVAAAPTILH